MQTRLVITFATLSLLTCVLSACSVELPQRTCNVDGDCGPNEVCNSAGFCVPRPGEPGEDAGTDPRVDLGFDRSTDDESDTQDVADDVPSDEGGELGDVAGDVAGDVPPDDGADVGDVFTDAVDCEGADCCLPTEEAFGASRQIELYEPCAEMSPAFRDGLCDEGGPAYDDGSSNWQRTNEPVEIPLVNG